MTDKQFEQLMDSLKGIKELLAMVIATQAVTLSDTQARQCLQMFKEIPQ